MSAPAGPLSSESSREVLSRLPHQPPFRFVTHVVSLEPGVAAAGVWRVTGGEDFFKGHFPDMPIVPAVLIAESLAQISGLVWFAGGPTQGARLTQFNVKVLAPVFPPADIEISSRFTKQLNTLAMFDVAASITRDGQRVPVAAGSLVLVRDMPQRAVPATMTPC